MLDSGMWTNVFIVAVVLAAFASLALFFVAIVKTGLDDQQQIDESSLLAHPAPPSPTLLVESSAADLDVEFRLRQEFVQPDYETTAGRWWPFFLFALLVAACGVGSKMIRGHTTRLLGHR